MRPFLLCTKFMPKHRVFGLTQFLLCAAMIPQILQKKKRLLPKEKPLLCEESRTVDMNKLRMTGFECFAIFVIRRAKHAPKGAPRH